MKIYDFTGAPNRRRVRVFLAEKGITNVPFEQVNLGTADNRKPDFLKINPMGGIPVLELDDGTHIAESVAICRYFETIKPEPPLMASMRRTKPSSRCGIGGWSSRFCPWRRDRSATPAIS